MLVKRFSSFGFERVDSFEKHFKSSLQMDDTPPKLRGDILKISRACDRWLRARGLKADAFNPRYEVPGSGEAES
jgi:hypothetical protein